MLDSIPSRAADGVTVSDVALLAELSRPFPCAPGLPVGVPLSHVNGRRMDRPLTVLEVRAHALPGFVQVFGYAGAVGPSVLLFRCLDARSVGTPAP